MKRTVVIAADCVNKGCTRAGVVARKVSDFWVVTCEPCTGKQVTLDFKKIPVTRRKT